MDSRDALVADIRRAIEVLAEAIDLMPESPETNTGIFRRFKQAGEDTVKRLALIAKKGALA